MGIDDGFIRMLLKLHAVRVEKTASGIRSGFLFIIANRVRLGLRTQVLRDALKPAADIAAATPTEVVAVAAVSPAPVAIATEATAVLPAAVSAVPSARTLCCICGEVIRSKRPQVCACCNKPYHEGRCGKGEQCESCKTGVLDKRVVKKPVSVSGDASDLVDEFLRDVGAEERISELLWLPPGPLPATLGGKGKQTVDVAVAEAVDSGAEVVVSKVEASLLLDASSLFYQNICRVGAAIFGGASSSRSTRFVLNQTQALCKLFNEVLVGLSAVSWQSLHVLETKLQRRS